MKIAIMQPYYYPYAGYFRLFAATDLFVILDDVQWNRRGRVHRRNKPDGSWDTLPIKKMDRDTTRIMDMEWQDGVKIISPVDWIVLLLKDVCKKLGLEYTAISASSLGLNYLLKGQDRIIAICKALKATEYINSPGGKHLYDEKAFEDNGIKLTFLPEWHGSYDSILERLENESPEKIKEEIYAQI